MKNTILVLFALLSGIILVDCKNEEVSPKFSFSSNKFIGDKIDKANFMKPDGWKVYNKDDYDSVDWYSKVPGIKDGTETYILVRKHHLAYDEIVVHTLSRRGMCPPANPTCDAGNKQPFTLDGAKQFGVSIFFAADEEECKADEVMVGDRKALRSVCKYKRIRYEEKDSIFGHIEAIWVPTIEPFDKSDKDGCRDYRGEIPMEYCIQNFMITCVFRNREYPEDSCLDFVRHMEFKL